MNNPFKGKSVFGILSIAGTVLSATGYLLSLFADPKSADEETRKMIKEEVKAELKASKEES